MHMVKHQWYSYVAITIAHVPFCETRVTLSEEFESAPTPRPGPRPNLDDVSFDFMLFSNQLQIT